MNRSARFQIEFQNRIKGFSLCGRCTNQTHPNSHRSLSNTYTWNVPYPERLYTAVHSYRFPLFFALIKQHERLGFFSILPKILLPRRSRIGRADSLDISLGTTISYNLLLGVQIVSLRFPYFALLLSFLSPGPCDYH